jgi:hypothetical protein
MQNMQNTDLMKKKQSQESNKRSLSGVQVGTETGNSMDVLGTCLTEDR